MVAVLDAGGVRSHQSRRHRAVAGMKAKRKPGAAPQLENLILYGSPKYTDPKDWAICRLVWRGERHIVIEYQERSGNTYLQLSTDDHLVTSGTREYLRAFQKQTVEKLAAEND